MIWRRIPPCTSLNQDVDEALHERHRSFNSSVVGPSISRLQEELISLLAGAHDDDNQRSVCGAILSQDPPLTLCIGGVTLGGAGKTPVVEYIARRFLELGCHVSILSHGYLSQTKFKQPVEVIAPIAGGDLRFGDEASMLRRSLPNQCRIWIGGCWRERWERARSQGAEVVICDGGLYTLNLPRHLGFVVAPTTLKSSLLPWGDLTRPVAMWPRSTGYIYWWIDHSLRVPRSDSQGQLRINSSQDDYIMDPNRRPYLDLKTPQLLSGIQAVKWVNADGAHKALDAFDKRRANILSAIARPERFDQALKALGVIINRRIKLRDHQTISRSLYRSLSERDLWLTTPKDLVKFKETQSEVWALQTKLSPPQDLRLLS